MALNLSQSSSPSRKLISFNSKIRFTPKQTLPQTRKSTTGTTLKCINVGQGLQGPDSSPTRRQSNDGAVSESLGLDSFSYPIFCSCGCGRRRFVQSMGTSFLAIPPSSNASTSPPDPKEMLNSIHPPRPEWYEELYAYVLDKGMKRYEAEVADCKSQLLANLRGKAETVLEIGIGTGPNLKYYAGDDGVRVFGTDPNRKMEKYARTAAVAAGLPPTNFEFMQAVAEALPLSDASVDAVVGTLVLCSVKDVDLALREVKRVLKPGGLYIFVEHVAAKDGTILRFAQNLLDPLQQTISDGCHLTRETGRNISEAGFSKVEINMDFLSSALYVNPHAYGIAYK